MVSQGLLFSEPSVAETGVWCTLSEGIDPAQWASLCRYIGTRNPKGFAHIRDIIMTSYTGQRNLRSTSEGVSATPLLSIGPSGIGGQFQNEFF
jgi:hypothetical protein